MLRFGVPGKRLTASRLNVAMSYGSQEAVIR
jgi:hypothetical protein